MLKWIPFFGMLLVKNDDECTNEWMLWQAIWMCVLIGILTEQIVK